MPSNSNTNTNSTNTQSDDSSNISMGMDSKDTESQNNNNISSISDYEDKEETRDSVDVVEDNKTINTDSNINSSNISNSNNSNLNNEESQNDSEKINEIIPEIEKTEDFNKNETEDLNKNETEDLNLNATATENVEDLSKNETEDEKNIEKLNKVKVGNNFEFDSSIFGNKNLGDSNTNSTSNLNDKIDVDTNEFKLNYKNPNESKSTSNPFNFINSSYNNLNSDLNTSNPFNSKINEESKNFSLFNTKEAESTKTTNPFNLSSNLSNSTNTTETKTSNPFDFSQNLNTTESKSTFSMFNSNTDLNKEPKSNPFDILNKPKSNLFDISSNEPKSNPFDILNKPKSNPFDISSNEPKNNPFNISSNEPKSNPFDILNKPKSSPFSLNNTNTTSNPFDLSNTNESKITTEESKTLPKFNFKDYKSSLNNNTNSIAADSNISNPFNSNINNSFNFNSKKDEEPKSNPFNSNINNSFNFNSKKDDEPKSNPFNTNLDNKNEESKPKFNFSDYKNNLNSNTAETKSFTMFNSNNTNNLFNSNNSNLDSKSNTIGATNNLFNSNSNSNSNNTNNLFNSNISTNESKFNFNNDLKKETNNSFGLPNTNLSTNESKFNFNDFKKETNKELNNNFNSDINKKEFKADLDLNNEFAFKTGNTTEIKNKKFDPFSLNNDNLNTSINSNSNNLNIFEESAKKIDSDKIDFNTNSNSLNVDTNKINLNSNIKPVDTDSINLNSNTNSNIINKNIKLLNLLQKYFKSQNIILNASDFENLENNSENYNLNLNLKEIKTELNNFINTETDNSLDNLEEEIITEASNCYTLLINPKTFDYYITNYFLNIFFDSLILKELEIFRNNSNLNSNKLNLKNLESYFGFKEELEITDSCFGLFEKLSEIDLSEYSNCFELDNVLVKFMRNKIEKVYLLNTSNLNSNVRNSNNIAANSNVENNFNKVNEKKDILIFHLKNLNILISYFSKHFENIIYGLNRIFGETISGNNIKLQQKDENYILNIFESFNFFFDLNSKFSNNLCFLEDNLKKFKEMFSLNLLVNVLNCNVGMELKRVILGLMGNYSFGGTVMLRVVEMMDLDYFGDNIIALLFKINMNCINSNNSSMNLNSNGINSNSGNLKLNINNILEKINPKSLNINSIKLLLSNIPIQTLYSLNYSQQLNSNINLLYLDILNNYINFADTSKKISVDDMSLFQKLLEIPSDLFFDFLSLFESSEIFRFLEDYEGFYEQISFNLEKGIRYLEDVVEEEKLMCSSNININGGNTNSLNNELYLKKSFYNLNFDSENLISENVPVSENYCKDSCLTRFIFESRDYFNELVEKSEWKCERILEHIGGVIDLISDCSNSNSEIGNSNLNSKKKIKKNPFFKIYFNQSESFYNLATIRTLLLGRSFGQLNYFNHESYYNYERSRSLCGDKISDRDSVFNLIINNKIENNSENKKVENKIENKISEKNGLENVIFNSLNMRSNSYFLNCFRMGSDLERYSLLCSVEYRPCFEVFSLLKEEYFAVKSKICCAGNTNKNTTDTINDYAIEKKYLRGILIALIKSVDVENYKEVSRVEWCECLGSSDVFKVFEGKINLN